MYVCVYVYIYPAHAFPTAGELDNGKSTTHLKVKLKIRATLKPRLPRLHRVYLSICQSV